MNVTTKFQVDPKSSLAWNVPKPSKYDIRMDKWRKERTKQDRRMDKMIPMSPSNSIGKGHKLP